MYIHNESKEKQRDEKCQLWLEPLDVPSFAGAYLRSKVMLGWHSCEKLAGVPAGLQLSSVRRDTIRFK